MLLTILKLITFCWLGWWAIRAMNKLAQGIYNSILIVIPILFLIAGVPLLLDILVGVPAYKKLPGFFLSSHDFLTNVIYCGYMIAIPPFWWRVGKVVESRKTDTQRANLLGSWRLVAYLAVASPAIFLFFVPDPSAYLIYGIVTQEKSETFLRYYTILQLFSSLSVLATMALLLDTERMDMLYVKFVVLFPWLLLSFIIYGKRTIIAIALFLFVSVLWHRGYLRKASLMVFSSLALITLLVFSYIYQSQVRTIRADTVYENFRIDYGRDDVIKMTIYAELNPDRIQILEHRGQSLLFYASIYVPRNIWPDKPLPYAQYFTSALLLNPPRLWGWGMTTSWLEEAIANLGWSGLFLGPLAIIVFCRIGDNSQNPLIMSLTALNASLLLLQELAAFMPFMLLWIAFNIMIWVGNREMKRKEMRSKRIVRPQHTF